MDVNVLSAAGDAIQDPQQICLFLEKMFGTMRETAPAMTRLSQWGIGAGVSAALIGGWTVFAGANGIKNAPESEKHLYHDTRRTGMKITLAGLALIGGIAAAETARDKVMESVPPVSREETHQLMNRATPAERTAYFMVAGCELIKGKADVTPYQAVCAVGETVLLFNDVSVTAARRREVLSAAHAGAHLFYFKQKDTRGLDILNHEYAFLSGMSAFVCPNAARLDLNAVWRRQHKER